VQFSGHESKPLNVRKPEDLARPAAGNGAKLICFPELFGRDGGYIAHGWAAASTA
jgi:predicted amidohydrolase